VQKLDTTETEVAAALPPALSSAGEARSFVRGTAEAILADEALDTVELLTSEVVTNAVLHAGDSPVVLVVCRGHTVRVSVQDTCSRWPMRRHVAETALSGRGIALVDMLASAWGIERMPETGKRVWFEVQDRQ
jgi:anti-sigma regulatory factor (Ser/Thr protein kinase)